MATKINKILITGSKGFIGKHLYTYLIKNGFEVISYDIKDGLNINSPVQLDHVFRVTKPDFVFHLAAISNRQDTNKNPELALKTNVIGTFNVLTIAKKYKIKTIIASSAATKEPELSLYGTSKDCMERIAALFDNVTIVRFYNVYGPGSKSVVNKFITKIKNEHFIKLNGNTTRDYIYVDDVVGGLIELMTWKGKIYELGTAQGTTLKQLARLISKLTGKLLMVEYKKPIKEIQQSQMKPGLGFFKPISLKEGIKKLI